MEKGRPPAESKAGSQGQSWARGSDTSIPAPLPRNTVPLAGMDTPRRGHPTSGPGAGQGRGQHTPAAGSQRPEGQSHALIKLLSLMTFGNYASGSERKLSVLPHGSWNNRNHLRSCRLGQVWRFQKFSVRSSTVSWGSLLKWRSCQAVTHKKELKDPRKRSCLEKQVA